MSFMKPQFEELTRHPAEEYMVCRDCLMVIANGEEPPDADPSWSADDMCKEHLSLGDSANDDEFSSRSCDCCGSAMAGSRYQCFHVNTSEIETVVRWRLSAPGYLDCTDWTECETLPEAVSDMLGMYGDEFDTDDLTDCLSELCICADDMAEGYFWALAFTARGWDDEPVFGSPGMDIRDTMNIEELTDRLTDDQMSSMLHDLLGFYLMCLDDEDVKRELYEFPAFEEFGSCFHYSRNRHGTGFFDSGWTKTGRKMQELAHTFGTCELMGSVDSLEVTS